MTDGRCRARRVGRFDRGNMVEPPSPPPRRADSAGELPGSVACQHGEHLLVGAVGLGEAQGLDAFDEDLRRVGL